MMQSSHTFLVLLLMVFTAGIVLSGPSTARRSRVRRQNMKVRINATGDTIVMKFLRPNADTKLEGYILGYGSSMFSKQFIQLPENGQPYETEIDAEPKYLIAVQPIPANDVKKHCRGKVELQKPLHLIIGSVTPTSVLLSWGTLLKTPYEGNIMNDCLEDGHYTVRYRERARKWNYQTCPTSDTVIDNLKPNTAYEFGVQPNSKDGTGVWSKPVIHNTNIGEKPIQKPFKPRTGKPVKPFMPGLHIFPGSRHVLHNRTQGRLPLFQNVAPKTTPAPTPTTRQDSLSTPGPTMPLVTKPPIVGGDLSRSVLPPSLDIPLAPKFLPPLPIPTTIASVLVSQTNGERHGGHALAQPQTQPQPQPQTKTQPHPQPHPESQPQPQPQPEPKSQPQPQPETQPKPHPQPQPETQPQPKPQPQPQSETQPKLLPQPQPKPQPKPHPQPQQEAQPKPQSQPQPETQPKPQSQPQPETQPKPHPQPQPKTQPKPHPQLQPEAQPKPRSQPQPETQPKPQSQPQPETQSQPQPETQSQPKPHPQPQPKTQPKSRPPPQPELQPQPKTQPQLQPMTEPKTQPQSQPKTRPKLQPQPKTWPKPQHQPKTRPKPQPQPKTQPKPQHQPKTRPKPQPQPKTQPKPQHQPKTRPKPQPQPKTRPKPQPQPQPKTQPQPQPKIQPMSQPQQKTKPQPQPEIQPTTQSQPQPKTQPKYQTQPQPKTQPQSQNQTQRQPKTQPKSQTQPQPKTQPQPQTQPQPKTQSQSQTQPQPKTQTKPQTQPQPNTQTKPHPQPQPEPKPHPQPQPETQPKPQPQPQPETQPKPQPQPQPETQPKPHPQPQPETQPKPHPQPQPETQPKPHPQPQPETQPKPQPQPPPRPQSKPQTRTQSPTRVTQRQMVPTAPSLPEEGKPLPRPALATEKASSNNQGNGIQRPSPAAVPHSTISSSVTPAARNTTLSRKRVSPYSTPNGLRPFSPPRASNSTLKSITPGADGERHKGHALSKPVVWSKDKSGSTAILHPSPVNKRPNLVGKPGDHDKPMDLKQGDKESILKPFPLVTAKPKQERKRTTTVAPALNSSRFDIFENSSIFSFLPASDLDALGKKRFVAPHVIYKTDKKPHEPCSITTSLEYFPDEEGGEQNVTAPPRAPPSNLTVVTVEGCPSFVILDWEKTDNDTTEYEVISTTNGPNGEEVSILTTNQTHTAVENLKPESSYEFTVKPRNELGEGPSTEPVSFSTESADPRVSENVSGKDAIWTQFPFRADAFSECNGKQYVKRTWYRKFVGIQLCNSLRYKIYLSDSLTGKFYNIGDQTGHGEDHCQFVDSFLDGRTGSQQLSDQLPSRSGFYRAMRQEPVNFGEIGGKSHVTYVGWYECGTPIPGKW